MRNTTRSRGEAGEFEFAKQIVIFGERTLTLEDLNEDGGLVIGGSQEDLGFAGGNDGITRNEFGENATSCLDTENER